MKRENWVWMPHPAHLIVADKCQFHLATYVGGYIVSTVGEWWPERSSRDIHAKIYDSLWYETNKHLMGDAYDYAYKKRFGFEEIGFGRKYETMVFGAMRMPKDGCPACKWAQVSGRDLDSRAYVDDAAEAVKGHMELCKKWAAKKPGYRDV